MEFIFFLCVSWIVFAFLGGVVWQLRGMSFAAGFVVSVLFSPLVGVVVGLVKQPSPQRAEKAAMEAGGVKKCPYCAELVKAEAKICRFCGRDVLETAPPKVRVCPDCGVPGKSTAFGTACIARRGIVSE